MPQPSTTTFYDRIKVVLAVVRFDKPDGDKTYAQYTPTADSNVWIGKGIDYGRPLYRLPEILTAPDDSPVFVVEGEKCVEAAAAAWPDKRVTCWAGGANAWEKTDWKPLTKRTVDLLADGDKPGHAAMLDWRST